MSDWITCSLGDFVYFQRGHDLPKTQMEIGEVPVAGSNGVIGYHDVATTKGPGITIGRSGNIGTPKFYKEDFWAHNTVLYVKDFKGNNPLFAYYFLRVIDFSGFNTGSAVPTLNRNHIHELEIKIPSLPEQKAIASVLSSLDDKIDLLHRQNKTLEAMAETLFRQWFIEEAKEDWEEVNLKELVSVIDNRGKTPPYVEEKTAHPIIEVNALTKTGRAIDYPVIRKYVTKDIFDTWFRQYLQPLDVVLSTVGSIGSFGMFFGGGGCVAQNIIGLRVRQKISNYFLYQWLVVNTNEIKELDIGSVQPSIKVPHLLSLSVKIPPLEKIELFDAQVKAMVDKIIENTSQIQTLENLRDTLLPKLMSGEIRVQYQTEEVA